MLFETIDDVPDFLRIIQSSVIALDLERTSVRKTSEVVSESQDWQFP